MALATLLPLDVFFLDLAKAEVSFGLPDTRGSNETEGGEISTYRRGQMLWQGQVSLHPYRLTDAEAIKAKIGLLRQPGYTFLVTPYGKDFPRRDPAGSILGSAAPTLQAVAANNRDITIHGLPSAYPLSAGDFLSFQYGGRYALHQVVSPANANGSGQMVVEVSPPVRPGWSVGAAVTLVRPICKCFLVPGSASDGASVRRRWTRDLSFAFRQTLKA